MYLITKGYFDEVGKVDTCSCASCGLQELVAEKPQNVGKYTSKEYKWSQYNVENTDVMHRFLQEDFDNMKNKNYYIHNDTTYSLYPKLIGNNGMMKLMKELFLYVLTVVVMFQTLF
jgi:hypothetical protein